jgi:hypothetical protein
VNQLPEPTDQGDLRASDADRHQVADVLRDAAGDGRLTLDELHERLDGVFAAKTYAELERFTRDLPSASSPARPAGHEARTTDGRIGGTPRHSLSVAFMSGATRRGPWVVPPTFTAVAFMGGIKLDLRDARFAQREVTIWAVAFMGGIEVVVPDDVTLIVDGVGIMGGFDDHGVDSEPVPGRPVVRVTGLAIMGGVDVKRQRRKGTEPPPEIDPRTSS